MFSISLVNFDRRTKCRATEQNSGKPSRIAGFSGIGKIKKAPSHFGSGRNPPKEEGGGDKINHKSYIVAMQLSQLYHQKIRGKS